MKPNDPHCPICGQLHGFSMDDLVESNPALPVYCAKCEARMCEAHGRLDCGACSSTAEPQGDRVRLFEPAPNPMAGQLALCATSTQTVIEKHSPYHFKATLNGRTVGSFTTEQEARRACATAMRYWFGEAE